MLILCPKQLNVERDEVEDILIDLILDGKVQGRIDQVGMRLEIDRQYVTVQSSGTVLMLYFFQTNAREEALCSDGEMDGGNRRGLLVRVTEGCFFKP